MVSTVDGAATGPDGRSGGINNAADKRVFDTLRRLCDAVVVGAGTARDEGYRDRVEADSSWSAAAARCRRGCATRRPGSVLMATCAAAEHLDETRAILGDDHVLVLGQHRVDLAELKQHPGRARPDRACSARAARSCLRDLLAEGVVDELDLTVVPRLLAGEHPRITDGPPVDVPLDARAAARGRRDAAGPLADLVPSRAQA